MIDLHTPAGRGGKVIEVTSLEDSGPGTLREAFADSSPHIIVFRVGGTIELERPIFIETPFVTVAGQTAPGDGITIKGHGIVINTHDVLLQYLRVRPGLAANGGIYIAGSEPNFDGTYNVVVDHVSASWVGVDAETMSIFNGAHDVTISQSIISESLEPYGHGMLVGYGAYNTSIYHNLFAHNRQRNPHITDGGTHDIVNNVIYNWYFGAAGIQERDSSGPSNSFVNGIGNYFLDGHSTDKHPELFEFLLSGPEGSVPKLFVSGNIGRHRPDDSQNEWALVGTYRIPGVPSGAASEIYRSPTRFSAAPISASSAPEAFEHVLAQAGATAPKRDAVDERIIKEVRNKTGTLITSPEEVGGYPVLAPGTAPADSDHDGIPDEWEIDHYLNENDAADGNKDQDGNGYTNIEEYLHSLMKK
ncbi:MAG: hypothetical protein Q8Q94_01390 [bacterium]|nr:hypothetical protein [bacterium]